MMPIRPSSSGGVGNNLALRGVYFSNYGGVVAYVRCSGTQLVVVHMYGAVL